jgi:integrase/recombinase XerD
MLEDALNKYKRDLALRGYSQKTQNHYFRELKEFLDYCKLPIEDISKEEIKDYLFSIVKEKKYSKLRQARSSIRYFFYQTLSRPIEIENIPTVKKGIVLPTVFSVEEVFSILKHSANLKHKVMLMLIYSSGLRVSEVVNLQLSDIVRSTMRLRIRQAKGAKDRYTILSSVCLTYLEKYYKAYRPGLWLFSGKKPGAPLSTRAVQHAFHLAKKNAGITKEGGVHALRHSFATHMLEVGGGIFQLQKFLGHKRLKTTLVYVHIQDEKIIAHSPLDVYAGKFNNASKADH